MLEAEIDPMAWRSDVLNSAQGWSGSTERWFRISTPAGQGRPGRWLRPVFDLQTRHAHKRAEIVRHNQAFRPGAPGNHLVAGAHRRSGPRQFCSQLADRRPFVIR